MPTETYEDLELSGDESHLVIRFNRPHKKNAFNPRNHAAMHRVLDVIDRRPSLKAVVLTGVKDVFCGGMDLEEYFFDDFEDRAKLRANFDSAHGWMRRWKELSVVTVASINGWCVGGGMLIAGICDLAIAANEATFCLSEINFGIFPAGGTTWMVAQHLTRKQALYAMLTGDRFDGRRAETLGLVSRSVPGADLAAETDALVASLVRKEKHALAYVKRVGVRAQHARWTLRLPEAARVGRGDALRPLFHDQGRLGAAGARAVQTAGVPAGDGAFELE